MFNKNRKEDTRAQGNPKSAKSTKRIREHKELKEFEFSLLHFKSEVTLSSRAGAALSKKEKPPS